MSEASYAVPRPGTRPLALRLHAPGPLGARRQAGFTLMELILVTIIVGVAVPGILLLFETSARSSFHTEQVAIATHLAEEKLEAISADKFSSVRGWNYIAQANYPLENPVPGFDKYERETVVLEVDPNDLLTPHPNSGYKRVTVIIYWNQRAEHLEIPTLFTHHP
ncbi:MAG: type II secretion system protein [Planctomycetes bacterium]|nr:type II secretion system protein [Planctomycetota bacterium]